MSENNPDIPKQVPIEGYFDHPDAGMRVIRLLEKKEFVVNNLGEYLTLVEDLFVIGSPWLFRGESRHYKYPCSSSISRHWKGFQDLLNLPWNEVEFDDFFAFENYVYSQFRRLAFPYLKEGYSDLELISLGQHYRLPTRLTDWTRNALVALYFSVRDGFENSEEEHDGYVYCIKPEFVKSVPQSRDINDLDDFIFVFEPLLNNERLLAQDGIFLLQKKPTNDLFYDLEQFGGIEIKVIRIPRERKEPILRRLPSLGIREGRLFPDIEGAAREIKIDLYRAISQNTGMEQKRKELAAFLKKIVETEGTNSEEKEK